MLRWFQGQLTENAYTMNELYAIAGISKQGFFQALQRQDELQEKEVVYIGLMYEIRELHPGMGLRTMYEQFHPEGIGRDNFIALGLHEGFRLKAVSVPQKTTIGVKSSKYCNLLAHVKLTAVNQVWVSDLFYFPLQGKHYYVVLIMDVYSRRIVGYSIADNMRKENNIQALNMAITLRGIPNYDQRLIHHSDRGSQYTSDDYTDLLNEHGIRISMCTDVLENAHCERVNGTIKNDYLNRWDIRNEVQLKAALPRAVNNYNHRNHRSLNKKTPIQFETFVKELEYEKRPKFTIFTKKQDVSINGQLTLFDM